MLKNSTALFCSIAQNTIDENDYICYDSDKCILLFA